MCKLCKQVGVRGQPECWAEGLVHQKGAHSEAAEFGVLLRLPVLPEAGQAQAANNDATTTSPLPSTELKDQAAAAQDMLAALCSVLGLPGTGDQETACPALPCSDPIQ